MRSEITVMIISVSHSIPNMLNKRNRHGNLWDRHVFHPDDLWICLGSYIQKSDWWGVLVLLVFICIVLRCLTDRVKKKRGGGWGLGLFLSTDFLIENKIGVVTMDLFYIIFTYQISSSVSSLATDYRWGVWGHRWTTCSLCGGPISGLYFQTIVSV